MSYGRSKMLYVICRTTQVSVLTFSKLGQFVSGLIKIWFWWSRRNLCEWVGVVKGACLPVCVLTMIPAYSSSSTKRSWSHKNSAWSLTVVKSVFLNTLRVVCSRTHTHSNTSHTPSSRIHRDTPTFFNANRPHPSYCYRIVPLCVLWTWPSPAHWVHQIYPRGEMYQCPGPL